MSIDILNKCEAFNQIEWNKGSDFYQRCNYRYKGIILTETIYIPHNIFKTTKQWTDIDFVLQESDVKSIVEYEGEAITGDQYYLEGNVFIARFKNDKSLVRFIDEYILKTN